MSLDPAQLAHARTIRDVCRAMSLPERALVIALETALDESQIRVLANANNPASLRLPHDGIGRDHASVGIFQQQPGDAPGSTVNWGTTHDCMDPALSAGKFFRALERHAWEQMSNWAAAQAVQVSAYADGSNYRRYDTQATALGAALWNDQPAPSRRRKARTVYVYAITPATLPHGVTHNVFMIRETGAPVPVSGPQAVAWCAAIGQPLAGANIDNLPELDYGAHVSFGGH